MNRPSATRLTAVALVAALVLFASAAAAEEEAPGDKTSAKRHFDAGLSLLRAENYTGAAAEFEASERAFPTRNAVFNLANCYQALGRYAEALDTFARLRTDFEGELPREMRESVERHEKEIRALTATLVVRADREGAAVLLNGAEVGRLPLPRPLVLGPGTYAIEVRLEGFVTARREVKLVSRAQAEEAFALVPARATITVDVDVNGAAVSVDGAAVGTTPLQAPLELEPGRHALRFEAPGYATADRVVELEAGGRTTTTVRLTPVAPEPVAEPERKVEKRRKPSAVFWTGFGLTVAVGAVAGGSWIAADHRAGDAEEIGDRIESGDVEEGTPAGDALVARQESAIGDNTLYSRLAIGFGIGAGALVVASAIVLALDLAPDDEEKAVSVSAAPGGLSVEF